MADLGQSNLGQSIFELLLCCVVVCSCCVLCVVPPEFHTTAKRTPNVHIRGSRLFKHHQNSTRRHPERDKKSENGVGEEKKTRNFGPHPSGPTHKAPPTPPLRGPVRGPDFQGPTFSGFGPRAAVNTARSVKQLSLFQHAGSRGSDQHKAFDKVF